MSHHEIEQLEDLEIGWRIRRTNAVRFAYLQAGRMLAAAFYELDEDEASRYHELAAWYAREAFEFERETNDRVREEYDRILRGAVGEPPMRSSARMAMLDEYDRLPGPMRDKLQALAESWKKERGR